MLSGSLAKSLLSNLLLVLLLGISNPGWAKFGDGLDEESMAELLKNWESDPGAVVKNNRVLRRLSAEQISQIIEHKDTSHYSFMHVVVIKGEELGSIVLNNPNNRISVMTPINNRMQPIPFQIDEVDIEGLAYFPGGKQSGKVDGKESYLDLG